MSSKKWTSHRVQSKQNDDAVVPKPKEFAPKPEQELPATTGFERQEATDTLSNFAHYSSPLKVYELESKSCSPDPNADAFYDKFVEKAKKISG